jgi:hypothetical protein
LVVYFFLKNRKGLSLFFYLSSISCRSLSTVEWEYARTKVSETNSFFFLLSYKTCVCVF